VDTNDFLKLLGQSGVIGVLLFILGKVIWRVAERLISAVDKLSGRIDDHTSKDLEHHGEVKEAIASLEGRIDGILDLTPVREQRPYRARVQSDPRGVPAGYYGPRKPTKRDDE